jgi:lambda family phage portal protein
LGYRDGKLGAVAIGLEGARAEYRVAKASKARSRARGISPMGSGADYHYANEGDFFRVMELARDCDRNDPIVGQGIDRLIDLVMRDGMVCDPDTGSDELDAMLAADWAEWSESRDACDVSGRASLHTLARLAARHRVVDGDFFLLLLESGQVQGVEAHRCRTPMNVRNDRRKLPVVHGVELNQYRRPVRYWFTKDEIRLQDQITKVGEMAQVPAYDADGDRNVLHIAQPDRVSQTRGVTALVRILETAGQHDDLQWATLVKAQANACFALMVEQEGGRAMPTGGVQLGPRDTETSADGFTKVLEQIAPGMIYRGRPGEKLSGYAPNIPNAEFFDHSRLILTVLAINLGLPVMVLLLDPSETNFSGWRGAMDTAKAGLRRFRRQMVEQFYRPIYQWRVRRLLAENPDAARLAEVAGVDAFRHFWKPPHDPYIEPMKDAQADALIIEKGLDSRRNVLASRGLDIAVVDADRVDDQKKLILQALEAAEAIAEAYPAWGGGWRDLLAMAGEGGSPRSGGDGIPTGDRGNEGEEGEGEGDDQGEEDDDDDQEESGDA